MCDFFHKIIVTVVGAADNKVWLIVKKNTVYKAQNSLFVIRFFADNCWQYWIRTALSLSSFLTYLFFEQRLKLKWKNNLGFRISGDKKRFLAVETGKRNPFYLKANLKETVSWLNWIERERLDYQNNFFILLFFFYRTALVTFLFLFCH